MNYIERNHEKCFSMPSLISRRLTVYDIVTQIDGEGLDVAVKDYEITNEQARASLEYCSGLACKINSEQFQFCDGCILRSIVDNEHFDREDYVEIKHEDGTTSTFSKSGNFIFSGALDELEIDHEGRKHGLSLKYY